MTRPILTATLIGLLTAMPVFAETQQLRLNIKHQLSPLDPDVDVDALSDQQVVELFLVLNGSKLSFLERRRKIIAVLN